LPDIRVVESHELPVDDVANRLGGFGDLLGKYGVHLDWRGHRAQVKGVPGVGGHVEIRPAEVEVLVTVSRMVVMLGLDPARLERTIRNRLGEALRGAG
jgi:hypothetical protein